MLNEVGSNFWLPQGNKLQSEIDGQIFQIDYSDHVYTSTGRSAISLILTELENEEKRVLLPYFTCESVIEPFLKQGYNLFFYHINNDSTITRDRFLEDLKTADPTVVLIHNYFGFDTISEIRDIISTIREKGTIVIEDLTQSLYSGFPRLSADHYVGSFRKWDGIPDGGYALTAKGYFTKKPVEEDKNLVEAKIKAMEAKFNYLFKHKGEKKAFLQMYSDAERILEEQTMIYKMAAASCVEQANLDISALCNKRRYNFTFLLNELCNSHIKPLFKTLPNGIVPLYFPVICEGLRDSLQVYLRDNSIYAPIVWPKAKYITRKQNNEDYLYENLICIPCDQRYGKEEMEYVISTLNRFETAKGEKYD